MEHSHLVLVVHVANVARGELLKRRLVPSDGGGVQDAELRRPGEHLPAAVAAVPVRDAVPGWAVAVVAGGEPELGCAMP